MSRLDWCLHWARDYGKPAADAFCQINGYAEAESWKTGKNITYLLVDYLPAVVFSHCRM
jgi:hypothetical protein